MKGKHMASKYEFQIESNEEFYRYPQRYQVDPFPICDKLYFVGNQDVSAHLIDTGKGLILIDTTYPTTDALLVQSIWKAGFNPGDIRYILHTHGHFDHFGATDLLVSLSGAKTFLGEADARMFRERPELALIDCGKYAYLEPFKPDVELHDGDCISLGDTVIRAVSTPGHTDGVMSFFFETRHEGETYSVGLFGGAGVNTLCRGFLQKYGGEHRRKDFLNSLEKVKHEKVDIMLGNHTGQNRTVEKRRAQLQNPDKRNPFINQEEWGQFLDQVRRIFGEMIEEEKEAFRPR